MKHRTCTDCGANLSGGAEVEHYRRRVSVRGTVQKQPQLLATGGKSQ